MNGDVAKIPGGHQMYDHYNMSVAGGAAAAGDYG